MQLVRWLRLSMALGVVAALSACANLQAVRDFTAASTQLTGYTDVTERYIASPQRTLAQIPEDPAFDADRANARKLGTEVSAARESLLKLHQVVTGYMAALAQLAGDGSFDISPQIDKVTGAIVAAPSLGLNADHVQAFGNIASRVSSWILAAKQAKEVKTMVEQNGEAMDKLLEGMEIVTSAMKVQLDNERGQIQSYEDTRLSVFIAPVGAELPPPPNLTGAEKIRYEKVRRTLINRKQAEMVWAARGYAALQAEEGRAVDSAAAAIEGIRAVRKGHDALRRNTSDLTRAELTQVLKRATADLRAIRDNLKKL